jgi:hypothetical protein
MITSSKIAVLTGDVVNSSVLSSRENADLQAKITGFRHPSVLMNASFYRGDSFQIAVKPSYALWAALKFRSDIKRWKEQHDLRISIGIGEISESNDNILLSTGQSFELSGKNLDLIKAQSLNIAINTAFPELDNEMDVYCFFIDSVFKKMTHAQANVVYFRLDSCSQHEIGKTLNISQPAVSKNLQAASWPAIEKILKRYSHVIEKYYGIIE